MPTVFALLLLLQAQDEGLTRAADALIKADSYSFRLVHEVDEDFLRNIDDDLAPLGRPVEGTGVRAKGLWIRIGEAEAIRKRRKVVIKRPSGWAAAERRKPIRGQPVRITEEDVLKEIQDPQQDLAGLGRAFERFDQTGQTCSGPLTRDAAARVAAILTACGLTTHHTGKP